MPRWAATRPHNFSFAAKIAGAALRPIAAQGRSYRGPGMPIDQLLVFEKAFAVFQIVFLQRRVQPARIQRWQHIPAQCR